MMKTQILIALGAVAALSGAANAQNVPNNGDVQLNSTPDIRSLFLGPITVTPGVDASLFGPDMPPSPKSGDPNQATLKLSVLKSTKGDVFQLEVARQSRAVILKKVTDVMGVRAVIDPALARTFEITQVFRGLSWDELLTSMNYGIEMVKSPAGTYFFADKSTGLSFKFPSNYNSQSEELVDPREKLSKDPHFDPFVLPYGGLNPKLKGWGVEPKPQPHWQKREFNGHEFYYIPGLPQPDLAK